MMQVIGTYRLYRSKCNLVYAPPQINYIICKIFPNTKLLNVNQCKNTMVRKWQYMFNNHHTEINAYQNDSRLKIYSPVCFVLANTKIFTECKGFYI